MTSTAIPAPSPRAVRGRLGYLFDPVPQALADAIRDHSALPVPPPEADPEKEKARHRMLDDRLRPLDAQVMIHLLRYRLRIRHSCWSTNRVIAGKVGCAVRSVQGSIRRLDRHGFIERVPVPIPDPDEPANRTGYRIVFLWLTPDGYKSDAVVDRRPPAERKVWTRIAPEGMQPDASPLPLTDPSVASAPMQLAASMPMQPIASKERASASNFSDGAETEKNNNDLPNPGIPAIAEKVSPSSRPLPSGTGGPTVEDALTQAEAIWGPSAGLSGCVLAAVAEFSVLWVIKALAFTAETSTRKKVNWGYVLRILSNFRRTNGPSPDPVCRRPSTDERMAAERAARERSRSPDPELPPDTPEDIAKYRERAATPIPWSYMQGITILTALTNGGSDRAAAVLAELVELYLEWAATPKHPSHKHGVPALTALADRGNNRAAAALMKLEGGLSSA